MRFAKDNALMLEAKKLTKVELPGGGYYQIDNYGDKKWYNDKGELHRLDGPAVEHAHGSNIWCVNGKLHRLDGPAVDFINSIKEWWVDGKQHRVDGPAVISPDGSKAWYVNGKRHRLDGPAIEKASGYKEWWVGGKKYSEEEFNRLFGKYKNTEDRQVVADMEGLF